jgi:leucyl aminopeptidase (aminopeptidase T)
MRLATVTVTRHAGVRRGEKVLILSDTQSDATFVSCLLAAAQASGGQVATLALPWEPTYPHAFFRWEEPPPHVAQAMLGSDVIIGFGRSSLCLTETSRRVCEAGGRILWMSAGFDYTRPVVTHEDYAAISDLAHRAATLLRRAERVHVTTAKGTDLQARLAGRIVVIEDGQVVAPGDVDFFPGGAWQTAPIESSVNGKVVFDGTLQGLGAVTSPLTVTFEEGWITKIEGAHAGTWRRFLDGFGDRTIYRFSHLGGGLARHAQIIGTDWEDLIMYGSVILSGGENIHFEGENTGRAHFDGTVLDATLELDGRPLIRDGVYVHPDLTA